ncbi:50S ribosomal protein L34e [Candidatus Woesearchaeota archaeon]|nr:50S ribosomal protein L34e [Candidatus Woesearchaeota archaeon]
MVGKALRSRSFRRIKVKVPGGRVVVSFRKRVPKLGSCHITGEKLKGVSRGFDYQVRNMSKSSKRPSRPYGGVLSSRAMRLLLKEKARRTFGE